MFIFFGKFCPPVCTFLDCMSISSVTFWFLYVYSITAHLVELRSVCLFFWQILSPCMRFFRLYVYHLFVLYHNSRHQSSYFAQINTLKRKYLEDCLVSICQTTKNLPSFSRLPASFLFTKSHAKVKISQNIQIAFIAILYIQFCIS